MSESADKNGEVVLVTGGSGFIGQHIIKLLIQYKDSLHIQEIRSVDLVPYIDSIDSSPCPQFHSFVGDIRKPETVDKAFEGVDCVFHCAALVTIQYPPNYQELQRTNIDGTRIVVDLCVRHNIRRLIYTSCASVCMVPFKGHSTFGIVINQTESKATTPVYITKKPDQFEKSFLIPGYSSTKLRAESIVLSANCATLSNQKDYLTTVAVRPPLTYGEGDRHFIPKIFSYLTKHGYKYPRIAGAGGKQQVVYAGNVAWGHICAYKTLKSSSSAIAGLPVFITDDTPIYDMSRFVQKTAQAAGKFKVRLTFWSVPHFLFYFLSLISELIVKLLKLKLEHSLRAIASFTASALLFNSLRAAIHMDYTPLVDSENALLKSARWYGKWWEENHGKSSESIINNYD